METKFTKGHISAFLILETPYFFMMEMAGNVTFQLISRRTKYDISMEKKFGKGHISAFPILETPYFFMMEMAGNVTFQLISTHF